MSTYNLAFCLYGFNRHSNDLRDLRSFFRSYFGSSPFDVYIYYALYDTETEFDTEKIDHKAIRDTLGKLNPSAKEIKIDSVPYSELDCLKKIKRAGARRVKNKVKQVFLHREYSMYCSMKRCVDMLDPHVRFDYVCVSRLDWGINEITNCKTVDIVKTLATPTPGIVTGHLNGNLNESNLSTDPRFIFGRYEHMRFVSELPTRFLEHVRRRQQPDSVDRVMHVHGFVSYVIVNLLKYKVISQSVMFRTITHMRQKVKQNKEVNANNEEEARVRALFDAIALS